MGKPVVDENIGEKMLWSQEGRWEILSSDDK